MSDEELERRIAVKREAGLEFLPARYHGALNGLQQLESAASEASEELARLRAYFLARKEVRPVASGGGSRSGARRRRRTGVYKCVLERHGRYRSLHGACRRLEREGKRAALLVLLRLAERSLIEAAAPGETLLPWEKPRLVASDLSGEVEDLTVESGVGAEGASDSESEELPEGKAATEVLAMDVEAYCAAHGLEEAVVAASASGGCERGSENGGLVATRVKIEPLAQP